MAFPDDLAAGPALEPLPRARRRASSRSPTGCDPDGDAAAALAAARSSSPALARRATALRADLSLLVAGRGREHVRWLAASPRNVGLHASPIDVGPVLGRALDACPGPIVFTSATLTVAGRSTTCARASAWATPPPTRRFPSPFRYDRQALLYLPPDLPDPNARRASRPRAAARMAELCAITGGRALLLFTSFRNMRIAEAHLREVLPFPLLVQGERPRHLLLASMRERIGSVLLATQSFWEGVDVPGEALSLVVMDKHPVRGPRRSADRGAHRSHPRRRRRAVRRLPAAARGARAEAGLRPSHPHAHATAASSPCSTAASRASPTAPR